MYPNTPIKVNFFGGNFFLTYDFFEFSKKSQNPKSFFFAFLQDSSCFAQLKNQIRFQKSSKTNVPEACERWIFQLSKNHIKSKIEKIENLKVAILHLGCYL